MPGQPAAAGSWAAAVPVIAHRVVMRVDGGMLGRRGLPVKTDQLRVQRVQQGRLENTGRIGDRGALAQRFTPVATTCSA